MAKPLQESVSEDKNIHLKSLVRKASKEPVQLDLRIDIDCARDQGELSKELIGNTPNPLKTQMLTMTTSNLGETMERIERDACVLGAYQHAKDVLQLQQSAEPQIVYPRTNDPFANQAYFKTMKFDRAQLRFFDPTFGIKTKVPVAVIDSGVDYNHPDLANIMWDDGNGNHGLRVYDLSLTPLDDQFHGTHVAGLIGAESNNGIGVRAIAGNVAEIMAINAVFAPDNLVFAPQDLITAIDFAVANGAKVINMSLGGPRNQEDPARRDAILRALNAGVVIVAAAGNDDQDASVYFPAANTLEFTGVISVGSIDVNGEKSSFSNFGQAVDIVASGNESDGRVDRSILSTFPRGQYNRISGTSMAAPVVAAAVALAIGFLETHNIPYNVAMIEQLVLGTARRDPALQAANVVRDGRVLDLDAMGAALYRMANLGFDPVAAYDLDYITNVLNQPALDVEVTVPQEVCL